MARVYGNSKTEQKGKQHGNTTFRNRNIRKRKEVF